MPRLVLCLLLAIWLAGGQAVAVDTTLPDELTRAAPEIAELIGGEAQEGFGLLEGVAVLWERAVAEVRTHLFSGIRSVAAILVGIVLLGVVENLTPEGQTTRYVTMVGVLWITAVSAGDMSTLIGLGQETISEISTLLKLLIPTLAAATAAAGGVTAASVRQVGTVFFSDILVGMMERLLIPLLYLYIGTAAAGTVLEGGAMESIGALLKKGITWTLRGLLILFTTYLTVSGAIAGSADAQTVKLTKSAVSTVVPVVGKILADAAETVLAGAGLLRGMIGAFGALAVVSLCLAPFLRLGIQYLLYQAAGMAAQTVGPKKLTKLLVMFADAFALILAMTASCALLLILSLVSMMTVVVT